MSVIYILIPIAILFTAVAIYLFFWAVKSEQFDDLEKQGMSILFDDEPVNRAQSTEESKAAVNASAMTDAVTDTVDTNTNPDVDVGSGVENKSKASDNATSADN
ncbi:cbb3-type cytochrome oxidase assembly protein CcoS [Thalassotalea litorea]|uniref:Cbb3-type cytochrome oxidase assembly protein CcoS n=1 Tax=Thalassotalea litorea TaxID=2020715 RepID=A0A5R9ILC8_9GAMM|nr:cbb3-type cytochrome oxidase assembly protein CcoS [Thalassotalea litorea]TLU66334.1 cbb3-type cytochrome oxidase assembly protein CcoS [Thalassotalea litorea]